MNPDLSSDVGLPEHLEARASRFITLLRGLISEKKFSRYVVHTQRKKTQNKDSVVKEKRTRKTLKELFCHYRDRIGCVDELLLQFGGNGNGGNNSCINNGYAQIIELPLVQPSADPSKLRTFKLIIRSGSGSNCQ